VNASGEILVPITYKTLREVYDLEY